MARQFKPGQLQTGSLFNISASYALTASSGPPTFPFTGSALITGSLSVTGSLIIQGNSQVSGSLRGQVTALSVTSGTASINMSTNNFFTLTLLNSITGVTHINPTNINPGQTANIRITQSSTFPGSISFPSSIKQASGSAYTASAVSSAVDIITLIAFDTSTVYLSAINRMI